MEINEILKRRSPAHYTVEEIQFAVQEYIFKKKGVRVDINIYRDFPEDGILNQWGIIELDKQCTMLLSAFTDVQNNYYNDTKDTN